MFFDESEFNIPTSPLASLFGQKNLIGTFISEVFIIPDETYGSRVYHRERAIFFKLTFAEEEI